MGQSKRLSRVSALVLLVGAGVFLSNSEAQAQQQNRPGQNRPQQGQGQQRQQGAGGQGAGQARARAAAPGGPGGGQQQRQQGAAGGQQGAGQNRARAAAPGGAGAGGQQGAAGANRARAAAPGGAGAAGQGAAGQGAQRARAAAPGGAAAGAGAQRARAAAPGGAQRARAAGAGAGRARAAGGGGVVNNPRIQRMGAGSQRRDVVSGNVIPTIQGDGVDFQAAADLLVGADATRCIEQFVRCMDSHIEPTTRYLEWLVGGTDIITRAAIPPDEAYLAVIDTGAPFRCVFWDPMSPSLRAPVFSPTNPPSCNPPTWTPPTGSRVGTENNWVEWVRAAPGRRFDGFVPGNDRCHCVGPYCFEMMDMNQLHSAYNFFCRIQRRWRNSIGRWGNQCAIETAGTFATRYSIAYYREVLRRVDEGELRMINIEDSAFFQNFISALNLTNDISRNMISRQARNQTFGALGLAEETELFSINVSPPVGSGTFIAGGALERALNDCFNPELALADEIPNNQLRNQTNLRRQQFNNLGCHAMRDPLIRYYLTGMWQNLEPVEGAADDRTFAFAAENRADGVLGGGTETARQVMMRGTGREVRTSFLSARDSCHMYELALMSVRDMQFGLFDTEMQNFIEDSLYTILTNRLNEVRRMQDVVDNVVAENERLRALEEERRARIAQADQDALDRERDFNLQISELERQAAEDRAEFYDAVREELKLTYASNILRECNTMMIRLHAENCCQFADATGEGEDAQAAITSCGILRTPAAISISGWQEYGSVCATPAAIRNRGNTQVRWCPQGDVPGSGGDLRFTWGGRCRRLPGTSATTAGWNANNVAGDACGNLNNNAVGNWIGFRSQGREHRENDAFRCDGGTSQIRCPVQRRVPVTVAPGQNMNRCFSPDAPMPGSAFFTFLGESRGLRVAINRAGHIIPVNAGDDFRQAFAGSGFEPGDGDEPTQAADEHERFFEIMCRDVDGFDSTNRNMMTVFNMIDALVQGYFPDQEQGMRNAISGSFEGN